MVASSSRSEGGAGRVPAENGYVGSAPRLTSLKCQLFGIFCQGAARRLHQSLDQVRVPNNMLHKEISVVASSSRSEVRPGKVPAENRHVGPAPRFNQRKVLVVWDFQPGCGRVAVPIIGPSE
ncbi:hypothetical protein J1N35_044479 [Gossypium stocksii]|uniref:Uncharacterized protein n=1 Tax=Gossypium stocksii TaxID=47602 RepID=A0A9D3U9J6_9ROSI|nr:hypothetical protein J1N35_044479 [Gossypium stocksii]